MGAFSSESGAILMTIDAALVNRIGQSLRHVRRLHGAPRADRALTVAAKDVVMVYKGQEYRMPTVKELRDELPGRDPGPRSSIGASARRGSSPPGSGTTSSRRNPNFFPPLTLSAPGRLRKGHMFGKLGFLTPLYFKNPGFAKGDQLTIKVRDKKDPELAGECEVILN